MKGRIICIAVALLMLGQATCHAFEIPGLEGYDMFAPMAEEIASGTLSLKPVDVFNNVINMIGKEIRAFSAVGASILIMSVISSTVGNLNSSMGNTGAGSAAFFTFFSLISGLALSGFCKALGYGVEVIGNMTDFMNKLTPVIIMTLFACCKATSAVAFEPVLSTSVFVVSEVVEHCLVPLTTFSAVLAVAGNIGDKGRISGFIKIIRSVTKWLMALVITVFTGINAIYGFTSPAIDAVGGRTLKFAVGSLVPVVGGFLSDTLDTVAASGAVMKNAVGVTGIIIMALISVAPAVKIGIMQIMIKLISALIEPISDKRITAMLWDMGEALTGVFSMVVLTAVMFIINMCIILRATG